MSDTTSCHFIQRTALLLTLVITQGCTNTSFSPHPDTLSVTSKPTGATVYTMSKKLGITPLTIHQEKIFPATYPPEQQNYYGILQFKKKGCKDQSVRVSTAAMVKGIDVKFDCGQPALRKRTIETGSNTTAPASITTAPTARTRLLQLNELYQEGLITEKEYQEIRKRILDKL